MVVIPKPNGDVRICVDLTKLKESVLREIHPLPSVDYTLAKFGGAKIFPKWMQIVHYGEEGYQMSLHY